MLKALRRGLVSAVVISFVPNTDIRSSDASKPKDAPLAIVTIVVTVVVVTVEIMADNQTLFRCQSLIRFMEDRTIKNLPAFPQTIIAPSLLSWEQLRMKH